MVYDTMALEVRKSVSLTMAFICIILYGIGFTTRFPHFFWHRYPQPRHGRAFRLQVPLHQLTRRLPTAGSLRQTARASWDVQHGSCAYFGACILYFIFSLTSGPWIPNRLSSFVPFLYIFLVDTTKQVHTATQSDLPSNFPMLFCEAPHLFNPFRWLELSKLFFDVLEADAAI